MDAITSRTQPKVQKQNTSHDYRIDRMLSLSQVVLFSCGIAAPVAGLVLAIIHGAFPAISAIGDAATILCIFTIPLLLLGSHLMDVSDRRRQRRREQRSAREIY